MAGLPTPTERGGRGYSDRPKEFSPLSRSHTIYFVTHDKTSAVPEYMGLWKTGEGRGAVRPLRTPGGPSVPRPLHPSR